MSPDTLYSGDKRALILVNPEAGHGRARRMATPLPDAAREVGWDVGVRETQRDGREVELAGEAGREGWLNATRRFYEPFKTDLERAKVSMRDVKREVTETELPCPTCGKKLGIKWGRNGEFLACPAYPDCKFTANFARRDDGAIEIQEPEKTDEVCDKCGAPMQYKYGKFGRFLGCSGYPDCKNVKSANRPAPTGIDCPAQLGGCGENQIMRKVSRRGRVFFGCGGYPKCDFALWDKPVETPCPDCEAPFVVEKTTKRAGTVRRCIREGCEYSETIGEGFAVSEEPEA